MTARRSRKLAATPAALLLGALLACGPETPPPTAAAPRAASQATLVCPVEGSTFEPDRGVTVEIDGATHRVCSRGCAIRLQTTPEKFLRPK